MNLWLPWFRLGSSIRVHFASASPLCYLPWLATNLFTYRASNFTPHPCLAQPFWPWSLPWNLHECLITSEMYSQNRTLDFCCRRTREWSYPRSLENPWDRPPSKSPWLLLGKNSRLSQSKVKAGFEFHRQNIVRLRKFEPPLGAGGVSFYGLGHFIGY